jgi:hypothetical protein
LRSARHTHCVRRYTARRGAAAAAAPGAAASLWTGEAAKLLGDWRPAPIATLATTASKVALQGRSSRLQRDERLGRCCSSSTWHCASSPLPSMAQRCRRPAARLSWRTCRPKGKQAGRATTRASWCARSASRTTRTTGCAQHYRAATSSTARASHSGYAPAGWLAPTALSARRRACKRSYPLPLPTDY